MIIAIDYDGTYTTDPLVFNSIIHLLQSAGHAVICVTGRSDDGIMDKPVRESIGKITPIIFAGKEWKSDAVKKAGYKVDIWIDDCPQFIYNDLKDHK
jgi:hypothetical protein